MDEHANPVGGPGSLRVSSSLADLADQLKNLRVFMVVASTESIASAAKKLFKAPSAVTRSVLQLEKAVGVQLFERNSRGITLNSYGRVALVRAMRIDAELQQAAADLSRASKRVSRSVINDILFNSSKLKLLIYIADTRLISAAAAQAGLRQSGASMALARMESALGQELFQRGAHGMIATETAHRVTVRGKWAFAELRHLMADLSAVSGTPAGSVIVGTLAVGRSRILPMAIAATVTAQPGINVMTVEGPFQTILPGLRSGEIDAFIGILPEGEQRRGLAHEPLFVDQLVIAARAGHPLAGRKNLRLRDLLSQQWVLPRSSSSTRRLIDDFFRAKRLEPPQPSVETADLAVLRQLLATTNMLAIVSPEQLMVEFQSGLLTKLDLELDGVTREIHLILREGALLSPAVSAILQAVRDQVRQGSPIPSASGS